MQYGNFILKKQHETTIDCLVSILSDMEDAMENIRIGNPLCVVESAEIIIKEDTIGWKVALLEPGEEEQRRKKLNVKIMDGVHLREEERKYLVGVLKEQRERDKIDLGEIIGL